MTGRIQPGSGKGQKEPLIPFSGPVEPEQEIDPRICYVCQQEATARCARCNRPVCEEHREPVKEFVTSTSITLCDECADHYDGVIMPH